MARRPFRRLTLVASVALVVGACSGAVTAATSTTTPVSSTTVETTSTTTSTTSTTTTTAPSTTTTSSVPDDVTTLPGAEVGIPAGEGSFPAVVLVHGGAWLVGSPVSIEPLAIYLTENGYLTVNASYQLSLQSPGFPAAIDDIACAVRFAASHPRSDGTVVVIGHSAGAHIGSLVALTGDQYAADDCPYPGTGVPERFIGLAGPYDISRLGPIMVTFFGTTPEDAPEEWLAGNPQLQVGENPALRTLLVHGDLDQVVPLDFSENFFEALEESGSDAEIVILDGVDHAGVHNPSIIGELALDWLSE